MLCINCPDTNPFYNLAAEEYLLRNSNSGYFMVWQSKPSVIVGKHQNTLAEINYRFTRDHQIIIARRLTGGGTVFHDEGNINFTFIREGEAGKLVNFASFIEPVLVFLRSMGIDAIKGPKHEILVGGLKISGNAEHVYKNRVLHHGTLLFSADLDLLRNSLKHPGGDYTDRAVQSNRSRVLNISECLPGTTVSNFKKSFFDFIQTYFSADLYHPDGQVSGPINDLGKEKYAAWDWVYGWSPDYTFQNKFTGDSIELKINLHVHRGLITTCRLSGTPSLFDHAEKLITGMKHDENTVRNVLDKAGIKSLLSGNEFEDLVFSFF